MNYYIVKINKRDSGTFFKHILNKNINISNIKYIKDYILFKISYDDYKKIKDNFKIKVVNIYGIERLKFITDKYKISFIFLIVSIFIIILLSNMIFYIDIDSSSNIKDEIIKELKSNNITLFSFKKNDKKLETIRLSILRNNKIKWISLDYEGVVLKVKAIENKKGSFEDETEIKDVVAKKNAYIRKITSSKGDVLKSVGDYVKKGETIVSGNIIRGEKVTGQVSANATIYGEVWYKEIYKESIYKRKRVKNKTYKRIIISIFNKDITLIKYRSNEEKDKVLLKSNNFILKEKTTSTYKYVKVKQDPSKLKLSLLKNAKKDIEKDLDKNEYIIMQKTLKSYIKNDKIYLEVFYKVYEDITLYKNIPKVNIE